jgi:hypothetical protein
MIHFPPFFPALLAPAFLPFPPFLAAGFLAFLAECLGALATTGTGVDATGADTTAGVAALGVAFLICLTTSVKLKNRIIRNIIITSSFVSCFSCSSFLCCCLCSCHFRIIFY